MKTFVHTVQITERHTDDGVEVDIVFDPADADYSKGITPGFAVGAGIIKAFRNGDLERLIEKYISEVK